jgi:hypothetical protein
MPRRRSPSACPSPVELPTGRELEPRVSGGPSGGAGIWPLTARWGNESHPRDSDGEFSSSSTMSSARVGDNSRTSESAERDPTRALGLSGGVGGGGHLSGDCSW